MNLIESVRNLFKPIEHEVIAEGMLVNDKHYTEIGKAYDEIDKAWNAKKYGLPTNPSPFTSDYPVYAACTTAMEDYPLKTSPFEDWECEWCGNMWASDIKSCEKCGGPKA